MTRAIRWSLVATALLALGCSRSTEPDLEHEDGMIVLRFEPSAGSSAAPAASPGARTTTAAVFDSVIVRVFRSGTPIVVEKWKGAPVGVDPIEMAISVIAESNKRISVELFYAGLLTYHGVNEDVDVAAGGNTPVTINASQFYVETLSVNPGVVASPQAFDVAWTSAPAAAWYQVQASPQANFATIEWEQTVTDTVTTAQLAPGMHYIRVIPKTAYASGLRTGPEAGYVTGGSNSVLVTGFSAPAVIPTETVTILGENLDFPGTRAFVGSQEMQVLSSTWGSLEVEAPRAATTNLVFVTSALGTDASSDVLIIQRVAYVTGSGLYAKEYADVLARHADDFGFSGMAEIPVAQLDTRDMGVFDIVIVASDTGPNTGSWGGGVPSRAQAIAASTANVLALGDGGLTYLRLAGKVLGADTQYATQQRSVYTEGPGASIFQTPHAVTSGGGGQWIDTTTPAVRTLAVDFAQNPSGTALHACTALNCVLLVCSPNDRWAVVEMQVPDAFSQNKRYVFWGHAATPTAFTAQGENLLGNAMYLLYTTRAGAP